METKIAMMKNVPVLIMKKQIPVPVHFLQKEIEKIFPCSVIGMGNENEKEIILYIKTGISEISINKVNEICDFMEHLFIAVTNIYINYNCINALIKDYHINIDAFYETTQPSTKSVEKNKNI